MNVVEPGQRADLVVDGVSCRECGYDLRGLPRGGACPECGSGVDDSVRRYEAELRDGFAPLHLSSTRWVRAMARACVLLLTSAALHTAAVVVALVELVMPLGIPLPLRIGLFAVYLVPTTAALWLLGTSERPRRPGEHKRRWLPLSLRVGAVIHPAAVVTMTLSLAILAQLSEWQTWTVRISAVLLTWAVMARLSGLARRAGREHLRQWAARLAWLLPAGSVVQAALTPILRITPNVGWSVLPEPGLGQLTAAILLPYSLYVSPRADAEITGWALHAALSVAAVYVVAQTACVLRRAAAGGDGAP